MKFEFASVTEMLRESQGMVRESQGNLPFLGPSSSTVRLQLRSKGTKVRESQGMVRESQGITCVATLKADE